MNYIELWRNALQNISGKTINGEFTRIDDLLIAFNNLYAPKTNTQINLNQPKQY